LISKYSQNLRFNFLSYDRKLKFIVKKMIPVLVRF